MNEPVNGSAVTSIEQPVPIPVRAGEIVKFTPKCAEGLDPAPIYKLEVPSVAARAIYQRDQITRCGGEYPDDAFVRWAFRRGVKQCLEQPDEVLAQISELEEALKEVKTTEAAMEIAQQLREIELTVSRRDPRYAEVIAARRFHLAMMPVIVLQHFLVGWENVQGDFRRVRRFTAEETLELIPMDQRNELAQRAMQLLGATSATAKNSARPS